MTKRPDGKSRHLVVDECRQLVFLDALCTLKKMRLVQCVHFLGHLSLQLTTIFYISNLHNQKQKKSEQKKKKKKNSHARNIRLHFPRFIWQFSSAIVFRSIQSVFFHLLTISLTSVFSRKLFRLFLFLLSCSPLSII